MNFEIHCSCSRMRPVSEVPVPFLCDRARCDALYQARGTFTKHDVHTHSVTPCSTPAQHNRTRFSSHNTQVRKRVFLLQNSQRRMGLFLILTGAILLHQRTSNSTTRAHNCDREIAAIAKGTSDRKIAGTHSDWRVARGTSGYGDGWLI